MSTIGAIQEAVIHTGICSKCVGVASESYAGCPFDGYCPAPDYHSRRLNHLVESGLCAGFEGATGKPCPGKLDAEHRCGHCGWDAYKLDGVRSVDLAMNAPRKTTAMESHNHSEGEG